MEEDYGWEGSNMIRDESCTGHRFENTCEHAVPPLGDRAHPPTLAALHSEPSCPAPPFNSKRSRRLLADQDAFSTNPRCGRAACMHNPPMQTCCLHAVHARKMACYACTEPRTGTPEHPAQPLTKQATASRTPEPAAQSTIKPFFAEAEEGDAESVGAAAEEDDAVAAAAAGEDDAVAAAAAEEDDAVVAAAGLSHMTCFPDHWLTAALNASWPPPCCLMVSDMCFQNFCWFSDHVGETVPWVLASFLSFWACSQAAFLAMNNSNLAGSFGGRRPANVLALPRTARCFFGNSGSNSSSGGSFSASKSRFSPCIASGFAG